MPPFHQQNQRIVVTGLGAVTPIGLDVRSFWEGLVNGQSGAGPITRFDASDFRTKIACELPGFDPLDFISQKDASRFDRFAQYAIAAADEAWYDAGLDTIPKHERDRIGVLMGTGIGGLQLIQDTADVCRSKGAKRITPFFAPMANPNIGAGLIAIRHGLRGPNHCVISGCATGIQNIADGTLLLQQGHADAMLCGGAEACITELGIGGFGAMRVLSTRNDDPVGACRPMDRDRDGFVMGEGGAMLVLETLEHARERGARIYAEIAGFGLSSDAHHYAAPHPEGSGLALAISRAMDTAQLTPDDVQYINLHATSTRSGDIAETRAIKEVFQGYAHELALSSTKSMTGHMLGAAGAAETIVTILAMNHDVAPPTINLEQPDEECDLDYTAGVAAEKPISVGLSNAAGFGGHNAVVALQAFD